jgi:hypothetical protein
VVISFEHPGIGVVAALAALATVAVAVLRRPAVPRMALALAAIGILLLAAAAGGMALPKPAARPVAVMVDLSASTRGAAYRDSERLQRRIRELLAGTPHEVRHFGEVPASRTILPETDAPAVLLFSDGRFAAAPDALPPVFVAIDSELDRTRDAAVTSLSASGESASVGVRNTFAGPLPLTVRGLENAPTFPGTLERPAGDATVGVAPGAFVLTRTIGHDAAEISATFAPGDLWPENDAMRALAPPPAVAQRWWVGAAAPSGSGWVHVTPDQLPRDAGGLLGAAVVVLDNVPADLLDDARRTAISQYVRDLGGGLLILGGERAFAAGGYAGTTLDAISPLASTPPEPTTHWLLLADASGSMNQDAGAGRTRWQYAADAVAAATKQLPPADLVSVGSFADDLRWWSRGKSVAQTQALPLPPSDARPRGKTNLDAALREIAAGADAAMPSHLLVTTDAQTSIDDPATLAQQLKSRRITLHILLIGDADGATGLAALQSIVSATGGTLRRERLPDNWASGLRELLRAAQPTNVQREPVTVWFLEPLASRAEPHIALWNRTWPKSQATALAEATTAAGERIVMAARWNVGEGRVAGAAFAPSSQTIDALARLVERPPRDPRFRVTWETGSALRISIDAVDRSSYLNGEALTLELHSSDSETTRRAIPQAAPGRYAVTVESPVRPAIATVRHGEQVLDVFAVAGRYATEFDVVGNDRVALAELARRTGGALVEPGVTRRLDIPWPRPTVSLVSVLATAGAALVAAGLVRWRIGS